MKKILKTCDILRKREGYYIFAVVRTPYGGITVPPAVKLPSATNASDLGQATSETLQRLSGRITEVNLSAARQPYLAYLRELGFKNSAAFEKRASHVAVHFDGDFFDIVPHKKDENGAFVAQSSAKLPCESCAEAIGKAILVAFERAGGE